jgi:hypothetical protein
VLTARLASALEPCSPNVMVSSSSETPLPFPETLLPLTKRRFPPGVRRYAFEVFRPVAGLVKARRIDALELRRRVLLSR